MRQLDLFPELKPPPKPRKMMMRAQNVDIEGGAHFTCKTCGHDAGWIYDLPEAQINGGLPCPQCNQ